MAAGRYRRIAAARQPQRVLAATTAGRRGAILAACNVKTSGPKGRHPLLTKQDGIELFHAYGAGVPGLTIAGAAA
jgi:hypothetical protein